MDIYVPWVQGKRGVHPEVIDLLGKRATFVNLTNNDVGYFNLMVTLWSRKRDFLIVEQDNLPIPRDIDQMESCPSAWCVCPYKGPIIDGKQTYLGALGCTRFRTQLMLEMPNFAFEVASCYSREHIQYHWQGLDVAITGALRRRGHYPCWHHEVVHLHAY